MIELLSRTIMMGTPLLYGNAAVGGVVNVLTRKALGDRLSSAPPPRR